MNDSNSEDTFPSLFAPERGSAPEAAEAWEVLVVDDEPGMHAVMDLVLAEVRVDDLPLRVLHARSGAEASDCLHDHPGIALVLLDVVMERPHAGLELIRKIRQEPGGHLLQVILVTGQPGYAPQREVITDYEINGYLLKAEMNHDRVFVAVHAALRSARALRELEQQRSRLALAMANLEQERNIKAAIVDYSEDAIIGKTTGGLITSWNLGAERIFGYTETEMLGQSVRRIIPPDRLEEEEAVLASIRAGASIRHYETERLAKDGRLIPISLTVSPILDRDGQVVGASKIARDISARKRAEQEAHALQMQLVQTQKMESLGQLAGGVAHDMNNVLGAILALASAHRSLQPERSQARQAFEIIAEAATRGGSMVKRLLNFARSTPADVQAVDLNEILREDVTLLERTTLSRIRLELDLAEHLPTVQGDPAALTHAIMNLCVNAVDAMPDRGRLLLRTRVLDDGWVQVQVADDGCGMGPEVLAHAIEPFYTTKPVGKGTGLGLSLVYSTVRAHGGRLELRSQPQKGTVVELCFPASGRPAAGAAPVLANHAPSHAPLAVLLVDDDPLVRKSTQLLLETMGHGVAPCAGGEEAVRFLQGGGKADVVILDMNMPGWNGAETLPRLRALRPELPVLLATGRADQTAMDILTAYPAVYLLSKPYSLEDLARQMARLPGG